ncbi:hypothetical protein AKO1_005940 [Acrasis kona]|uniref:Uncharacterized protein n=1 Tax=Acrasis kona TaxID=1008807 RepID=A0AAW2YJT4_9EUKA
MCLLTSCICYTTTPLIGLRRNLNFILIHVIVVFDGVHLACSFLFLLPHLQSVECYFYRLFNNCCFSNSCSSYLIVVFLILMSSTNDYMNSSPQMKVQYYLWLWAVHESL